MRISIGSDHAGFALKQILSAELTRDGHTIIDMGTNSEKPVDYPPYCAKTARAVIAGQADLGIVIGGSGQGEAITANKVHGIRAALCHDETTARLARLHNNANVLSLGARIIAAELATTITQVFLATDFEHGRHVARLAEIAEIEVEEAKATN